MAHIGHLAPRPLPGLARARSERDRNALRRYGVAIAATALALLGTLTIDLTLHAHTNLLFVAAVAVGAWDGGRGPGLLASALAVLAIEMFAVRHRPALATSAMGETVYLAAFLGVAFVVSATTEMLRHARTRAEGRAEKLEEFNVELEQQVEEVQTLSERLQESNDALSDALAAAERMASRAMQLQEVTSALSQAGTERAVADVVLGRGLGVVQGARGVLARVDGTSFEVIRATGYASDVEARMLALSLDDAAPLTAAVKTGAPVWLRSRDEYRARFSWAFEQLEAPGATQAYLAVPLRQGEEIVGVLEMSFLESSARGVADQAFTLLLAQAAADALRRARSYDIERGARREAETLAQARADVLGIVAHDLRNPLNVIGSSVQLLLELEMPAVQRRGMLEIMQRAGQQMDRMIRDLLDATRLRAGRLSLVLRDVDARVALQETEATFRHVADAQHVRLQILASDHACLVRADEGRVLQALGNLVGNALKFTGAGGCVSLSAQRSGDDVVFCVADTGPGIAAAHQDRLFDRFWQARDGDRRGVGLGLTIAKGIVDAHGGRIWVDSTPGVGSTFAFAIPVAGDIGDAD